MGRAVSMDVKLAATFVLGAVIVNANVTFGQAMCEGGIVGKREGGRRCENTKCVEHGQDDRRLTRRVLVNADIAPLGTQCAEDIRCFEDRALLAVCNASVVRPCRIRNEFAAEAWQTIVR